MSKRFTDSDKWTKNKWFRKLPKDLKLFWLYICDSCDCVGVWEEDIDFFNSNFSSKLTKDKILDALGKRVYVMPTGKKWWIVDFCLFQYGVLKEENIKNKPHQKYIQELKRHRLWIDYTKTMDSLKEKEEEKDKDLINNTGKGLLGENQFDDSMLLIGIDDCKAKWLSEGNSDVRFSLGKAYKILPEVASIWLDKFCLHLKSSNTKNKTFNDFCTHFSNWLRGKDLNQIDEPKKRMVF